MTGLQRRPDSSNHAISCGIISKREEKEKSPPKKSYLMRNNILQSLRLPGENPLVQTDPNSILRVEFRVKRGFEVSMRTQRLLDEATAAAPGPQLQSLEPVDILSVEEHVPHRDDLLVDLERMARENGALGDHARLIWRHDSAGADEAEVVGGGFVVCGVEDLWVVRGSVLEDEDWHSAEGQWADPGGCGAAAGMQETVELVDVVGGVVAGGEDGVYDETARAALDDELLLGLQRLFHVGVQGHVDVDHGVLVLMAEEREQGERLRAGPER